MPAPDASIPVCVDGAVVDAEFENEDDEFEPKSIRISAADKPQKAFKEESMPHLSLPFNIIVKDGSAA